MEDLLRVGVISYAHGIKGEVNVFPTTDEPEMFAHWKTLRLVEKKQSRLIHVRGAKYFKNMVILSLEEIADRNQAELLRQAELYITRDQATPCGENENFITDLIGLRVVDENKEELGKGAKLVVKKLIEQQQSDGYVTNMGTANEKKDYKDAAFAKLVAALEEELEDEG